MPVPNTFANATATIPLSQLDANFATTITLGNTAIQLGNTVSTLNNMTLANVTVTSGNVTLTNVTVTTANVTTANIGTQIVTTSQTLNYGTANGVVYLNGSKVSTTGTALTYDGTTFTSGAHTVSTGVLTVPAGSNTAPSITFSGDTNTGIFSPAADTIAFSEGGVESMRIDASGNLGLGVTPSAWSLITPMQIKNASFAGYLNRAYVFANSYFDGSNNKYIASDHATYYAQQSGQHQWYNAASGTAGNNISFTQAMTLDADGDLGVGTSSPGQKLTVIGGIALGVSTANQSAIIEVADGSSTTTDARFLFKNGTSTHAAIRLVLNSASEVSLDAVQANNSATTKNLILNANGGEVRVGSTDNGAYNLQCNGTAVWGAGAYVNGSDARIKEDVAPIASGLDVVTKLNPVTYRYKEDWSKDQSTQTGFIAQELLTALEGQVYVDGVVQQGGTGGYYSVAYQNIIPILTKAIQEQQQMIETLQAEVALLKGAA